MKRTSSTWLALVVLVFLALLGGSVLFGVFLLGGGFQKALAPGPLHGTASFELLLEADKVFAPGDADAMRARLDALGVDAAVIQGSSRQISVSVRAGLSREAVLSALEPKPLAIHSVRDLFSYGDPAVRDLKLESTPKAIVSALPPPGAESPAEEAGASGVGDCEVIQDWVADHPRDDACVYRLERESEKECVLRCLTLEPSVTERQVEVVSMIPTDWGGHALLIQFDRPGTDAFAALTRSHVGQQLAFVVGNEIVAAPTIMEEISQGRTQITFGDHHAVDTEARRVAVLAAALHPRQRVQSRWHQVRE